MKTAFPGLCRTLAVCMVLACAASVNLQRADAGLLTNEGAETGDLTGWTVDTGTFLAVTDVGTTLLLPKSGDYFFRAYGNGYDSQMHQDVDVSTYAAAIDAGNADADLSLWMSDDGHPSGDYAKTTLDFYDANPTPTLLDSTSVKTSGAAWLSWFEFAIDDYAIPVGTRTIRVVLDGHWGAGNTDAYFDDIDLNVNTAVPEPSTGVLLGLGGLGLLARQSRRRRRVTR